MSFRKGEIIVRRNSRYPEGALVVDGYDNGALLAHPLGGGLQYIIPVADQSDLSLVSEAERTPIYRKTLFEIEGVIDEFVGWTSGGRWNGWAVPQFEFSEAQRLVGALGEKGRYDPECDAFMTQLGDDEPERWEPQTIALPDGSSSKCYPIGAGSWIWEEVGGEVK